MTKHLFVAAFRDYLLASLPEDTSLHGEPPEARQMYLPATHAKALAPNSMLIEGMRGSGKSFWFSALQKPELRSLIGKKAGIDAETLVSIGFGESPMPGAYPGKDVLVSLIRQKFDPRHIWKTVAFKHVLGPQAPSQFNDSKNWPERITWVQDNPELVENALYETDQSLESSGKHHLVLFDALDRTADDWTSMNALVRGLLQLVLDFRTYKRIRVKVFARPDQLEDPKVGAFPDSSKVMTQKVNLEWPRRELYGLLWQYLANGVTGGEEFRRAAASLPYGIQWDQSNDVWLVPDILRNDEDVQKLLFHAITGPWMGRDKRRGFPYSWLPSHLADAHGQVSPRSFLAALRHAAEEPPRTTQEYVLHYESIKAGVQEASKIRVRELEEDYPWVGAVLKPLSGISVPCDFKEVQQAWAQTKALDGLKSSDDSETVRLPPIHIAMGAEGVLKDLMDLGLVERLKDKRINLPDVYRVGYGMGRKGGVKPVRR